jgi:putative ABC transport system permease protein
MPPLLLVWRSLWRRPLRSLLTVASLAVAIFLVCGLRSILTTIRLAADNADPRRLWVLSATGLFLELPLHYQERLAQLDGVDGVTKFQWFGGYYRNQQNFFAQFAVDPEMFGMFPEAQVDPETITRLRDDRRGCVIGSTLAREYQWSVGDTIPITGALHPHPEDKAWEFRVAGIYHSDRPNFDNRTLYFRWDYYEETLKSGGVPPSVGVYVLHLAPGASAESLIQTVEDTFRDAEQRVDCDTESEFQRQFQSMFGNMPLFLAWIGGGVLIAILVACVNTMLMSLREQTAEVGILKSLGFTDASMLTLFLLQSIALCVLGGGVGMLLAFATQKPFAGALEMFAPGYRVQPATFAMAAAITLGVGLLAGLAPALLARRLSCIDAFRRVD